jgi:hypothetical protein
LLRRLFKTANIKSYVKYYAVKTSTAPFHTYINNLCEKNEILPAHVIKKSGIERTYGHHLFSGARKPSRDKVIMLAFGFEMDYKKAQELLKIGQKRPLHPKIMRDAVIIYALTHGLPVVDVQITLGELELPLLGKEERYG